MAIRPKAFDELVASIARLPGIGPKSAARVALWLLAQPASTAQSIAGALTESRERIRPCDECRIYSEGSLCPVCGDAQRDRAIVCVVEESVDAWRIEETGCYRGLYHVLGGVLSPLDGVGIEDLEIASLVGRLQRPDRTMQEVILATDFDTEGNATALYLAEILARLGLKTTRPAYGLPAGGELAYSNDTTLIHALSGRQPVRCEPLP